MKKNIIMFFFLLVSMSLSAQSAGNLQGKWIFKKALNKEVDDLGRQTLKADIINKMTFEFKSNSEFNAFAFGQNMKGKWSFNEKTKLITLITPEKEELNLLILKLNETEVILKLGLGEFLMKKI
ncbi:DUF4923 family protein [uncultured Flavobacterium sp.]|jgi:hypothetical protein|uniref:lipocalin-like domain-containing protein n=1 Tax=uncultured Flavobacterium sp. TaxID=165435 RepID=UPI0030EBFD8F|tara:strand:+ start:4416 stop:4787 length:372 start_codon:yes stop_codon:yes gene_type:complete